jgi:hypothetical protein
MAYSKFFLTNRKIIIYILGYSCVMCKYYNSSNHVHHIDYNSLNDNADNFVVVCKKCHTIIHRLGIKIKNPYPKRKIKQIGILL